MDILYVEASDKSTAQSPLPNRITQSLGHRHTQKWADDADVSIRPVKEVQYLFEMVVR